MASTDGENSTRWSDRRITAWTDGSRGTTKQKRCRAEAKAEDTAGNHQYDKRQRSAPQLLSPLKKGFRFLKQNKDRCRTVVMTDRSEEYL